MVFFFPIIYITSPFKEILVLKKKWPVIYSANRGVNIPVLGK